MKKTQDPIENFFDRCLFEHKVLHMTITKKQAKVMLDRYPALKTDRGCRLLFVYILMGRIARDKESKLMMIPCQLLAHFEGKPQRYCRTEDLLERFGHLFPDFVYQDYYHQGQKCRQIILTGIPEMFHDVFAEQQGERIYVDTLKAQTYKERLSRLALAKRAAMSYEYPYKDAERIARYHLAHTLPAFLDMIERHFRDAWEMACSMTEKDHHCRVLQEIYDQPVPIYFPSHKSKTPRVFTNGLGYLQAGIRHILCQEWIELDLKSCQLAIAAKLGNIASLQLFLSNKGNIWSEIMDYMCITEQKKAKKTIKEGVYSIVYGKAGRAIEKDLTKSLAEKEISWTQNMTAHPLMKDLLTAIKKLKNEMQQKKGWEGAYGWIAMEPKEDIDSFLSRVIQSYELKLIYACYEVAFQEKETENQTFTIMLHQHDGISIKLRPGVTKESVIAKIQRQVQIRATEMNIVTWIEG